MGAICWRGIASLVRGCVIKGVVSLVRCKGCDFTSVVQ